MKNNNWQMEAIINMLDRLDERKLSNVYHFVQHISGNEKGGEVHE